MLHNLTLLLVEILFIWFFIFAEQNWVLLGGVLIGAMQLFCMSKLVSDFLYVCSLRLCIIRLICGRHSYDWEKISGSNLMCLWILFSWKRSGHIGYFFINTCLAVAVGFRATKDHEKAKTAFEKASKGQEMLSSYPYLLWFLSTLH